jgi:Spx/MgsR family transcriptional regulator
MNLADTIEIYVHPTCTSCRKAQALLDAAGASYSRRDYFKDHFTTDELRNLLHSLNLTAHDVLSTRAGKYRELGLDQRDVSEDQLIQLMTEQPTLLRRPLVRRGSQYVVGYNKTELESLTR